MSAELAIDDQLWVEVEPISVTAGMDSSRPVMIFREVKGTATLPVWLSPLDAGIAIVQDHTRSPASSPHDLAAKVFEKLELRLEKCFFNEMRGHHQFVKLQFAGSNQLSQLELRADQAISFCLHAGAKFFSTREFMGVCRDQDAQLLDVSHQMKRQPGLNRNPHPYLI